jgi:alpha-tubulin suppressor-like RCC1 family protein
MSERYVGAWEQAGLFNPLNAPSGSPYQQYGGTWTLSQASDAVAQGKWPSPSAPHLYAWGENNTSGQLGLNNTNYYSSPKQVGSLTNWSNVSGGNGFSLSTKTDGTLWSIGGQNNFGQLGLGNITYYSSPKQIGSLTNWSTVSAGYYFSLGLKTDGTLWSWGNNASGQLGLSNVTSYSSPKQVGALTTWIFICAGYSRGFGILSNNTLWSWGNNANGALGLGNLTAYSSPKQIGSLTNWASVSSGQLHAVATKTDGTLWVWGYNGYGELGLGNTTNYSSPKQVGILNNWSSAKAGYQSTIALKTDGTLWAWGDNGYGELGQGNTTNYSSPKQVGSLTNWYKFAYPSLGRHVLSIKTDGTLWSWGQNLYGELGLNNSTAFSSPKQVGNLTTWLNVATGYQFSFGIAKT